MTYGSDVFARDRRRATPRGLNTLTGLPRWSIALTALVGSWTAHFAEYVRVAGWQTGRAEMSSSVHTYFFPAGAALMAVVVGVALLGRRAWRALGERLRAAELGIWHRPKSVPNRSVTTEAQRVGLLGLWVLLFLLQTGTWFIQENLEAIGSGERAPLLGVVSGVHWLAPVVEAEVALTMAVALWLVHGLFARRRNRVVAVERLVARRWSASFGLAPLSVRAITSVPSTPEDRWGSSRWQRPPPLTGRPEWSLASAS